MSQGVCGTEADLRINGEHAAQQIFHLLVGFVWLLCSGFGFQVQGLGFRV